MNIEKERTAFEAWAKDRYILKRSAQNAYMSVPTMQAWEVWQARANINSYAPVVGRWYFVTNDGAATLCVDEADARESAAEADIAFSRMAPHRAVQLVPASQLAAAVAKERDRCLRIVESVDNHSNPMTANDCADAIRAGAKESSDA